MSERRERYHVPSKASDILDDSILQMMAITRRWKYLLNGKPPKVDYSVPGGIIEMSDDERLELVPVLPKPNLPRRVSKKPGYLRKRMNPVVSDWIYAGLKDLPKQH